MQDSFNINSLFGNFAGSRRMKVILLVPGFAAKLSVLKYALSMGYIVKEMLSSSPEAASLT